MLPVDIAYIIYEGIGDLPHFNDADELTETVIAWRKLVAASSAVLICTPEYAFGVPGSLKNALDWTVASTVFTDKPVALITASSVGDKAHAALQHTLHALGTKLVDSLLISFIRSKMNEQQEISDLMTREAVQLLVNKLVVAIEEKDESNIKVV